MSNPILIPQPFAASGNKNDIQNTRQAGQDPEDATWSDGFPAVTMTAIEAGGLPPKGMDFNGIFHALSDNIVHLSKGGRYYFDLEYATKIGGYSKGSILLSSDNSCEFISEINNNLNNPNSNLTGWSIFDGRNTIPKASTLISGLTKLDDTLISDSDELALTARKGKFLNDNKADKLDVVAIQNRISSKVHGTLPRQNGDWGMVSINVLGDSISHGAFAQNLYRHGYVNILKHMLNVENKSQNYGFVSILPTLGDTATENWSKDIHDVAKTAEWAEQVYENATTLINGYGYKSTVVGAKIIVTVPTFQKVARIWYKKVNGGGSFEVKVNNGAVVQTVNCHATTGNLGGYHMSADIALVDNGFGKCAIDITQSVAGEVVIMGVSYFIDTTKPTVNNFSQSGRKLAHCSELLIKIAAQNCKIMVMALGHNDRAEAESNPTYLADFKARINWLIKYCTQYGVKLFVLETCWDSPKESYVRIELKRLADSTPGAVRIPFPDLFSPNAAQISRADLQNKYKFLADTSHPTVSGNQLIAEVMAGAMQTSVQSKVVAESNDDSWLPLTIKPSSPLRNQFTSHDLVSAYRYRNGRLELRFYLKRVDAGGNEVNFGTGVHEFVDTIGTFKNLMTYSQPIFWTNGSTTAQFNLSYGANDIIKIETFALNVSRIQGFITIAGDMP